MFAIVASEPFTAHYKSIVRGLFSITYPAGHVCAVRNVRATADKHAAKNRRMFKAKFTVKEVQHAD